MLPQVEALFHQRPNANVGKACYALQILCEFRHPFQHDATVVTILLEVLFTESQRRART